MRESFELEEHEQSEDQHLCKRVSCLPADNPVIIDSDIEHSSSMTPQDVRDLDMRDLAGPNGSELPHNDSLVRAPRNHETFGGHKPEAEHASPVCVVDGMTERPG